MNKIGNNLRDYLARDSRTIVKNTILIFMGEKYKINPYTWEDTEKACRKALETIKGLL